METLLTGLTWDHPRGYAPLFASVDEYQKNNPGAKIRWDRRSLRDFGEAPIETVLSRYDLIVVDHPFVGYAAANKALVEMSPFLTDAEKERFAADSVGRSWESYWYQDGLWALPIDSAAQVASYREDLLEQFKLTIPRSFEEVLGLGKKAREIGKHIIVAACPTDAMSLFLSFSASQGYAVQENGRLFIEQKAGLAILKQLHELISLAYVDSVHWNPIQVYDFMSSNSDAIYCPYAFGYSNYSRAGNAVKLKFTDAPGFGGQDCASTLLGGAGIAISHESAHAQQAVQYAKWLVSAEYQRGAYFNDGGQPGSKSAWIDPAVNAQSSGFFSGTLKTLQNAYLRPRFNGFVRFFEAAGIEINKCLKGESGDKELIAWLNSNYRKRAQS
jgi:multiple sugar transport system substrate-binding protein